MKKRWAERFWAMFLAAMLVFVNDSVMSFALTVKDGEAEVTEPDGERWQHYEEPGENEGDPTKKFDLFDGSKATDGLTVELTNEDVHNAGEEGEEGWYPTEDKNYIFVNGTEVSADLADGMDVGFFRDNTVELTDSSESGVAIYGDGCDPSLLHEDGDDEGEAIIEEIVADGALLEEMRTTAPNPYVSFGPEGDYNIIVEVALVDYERPGDAAFPVSIGSVSADNKIDGWDRMKARVSAGSITLSWPEDLKPTQICIEDGDDDFTLGGWEIRDIEDGVTSVSVKVGTTERHFYFIEVKYGEYGPENHSLGVDFLYDLSALPGDDDTNFSFDIEGYRDNDESFGLANGHYNFGKSDGSNNFFDLSVSDDAVALGFRLQTAGKKVVSASYKIGENTYPLSDGDINNLTSNENYFRVSIRDGEDWIELVEFSVTLENDDQGGGGGGNHALGVDFLPDLSALPGDDDTNFSFDIEGYRDNDESFGLANGHYNFGKSNDGEHLIDLSVPDDTVALGFRLQTAGKKVVSASYKIGENTYPLSDGDINNLTSNENYFRVSIRDGEDWIELVEFSVTLENDDQGGGHGGGGQGGGSDDITYSENTTISEDTVKNDVTVQNATLTIADGKALRIDHRLDVEGTGTIVGASGSSKLIFAGHAFSNGMDLYCNSDMISSGPSKSFINEGEGPSEFTWDTSLNRWVTDHNPTGGGSMPWYTVSYGNSANVQTEHGYVYAERVHVGDITYTLIEDEYNESETDQIYSLLDTIGHQRESEEEPDSLQLYGIGASDGDIFFSSDIEGASIDYKFIPDFGYQLKNIYTNEQEENSLLNQFSASADTISSFTFNVAQGHNVHFQVKFVEANNTVTGNAGLSSAAKIESTNAAESGTLAMNIDSGTQSTNIPAGSEALAAYDITLKNVVSKGEGRGNWETAMTDLGEGIATVTLPVSDTTNYTYTVIRNHNGTETTLDATVTSGGISFDTNQFSTYTIVKKPVAKSIASATVTLGDALTYSGSAQTQAVSRVKLGETTLNASTDYEITNASKTDAGTYTLTVTGKGNYKDSVTKQFTIAKATLTPSVSGSVSKAYDGAKSVSDSSTLSIALTGKYGSDDVTATASKYEYDTVTVGTGKSITATGITLSGAKAANYELASTTAIAASAGEITKATPVISFTTLEETNNNPGGAKAVLSPSDAAASVLIEYKVVKNIDVSSQEVEYEWVTTRPTALGTYEVRATLPTGTDNLNAVTTPVTGTYKLTQYVAPTPTSDSSDSDSKEEPKAADTNATAQAVAVSTPVTKTAPKITPIEPSVTPNEKPLIVPSENIEAKVPEGISEEAKENLTEQVADTVSELVESILAGDENIENAVSEETLENIKAALEENKEIVAVVTVNLVDESSIPSEDKAAIEEIISKEAENNIEIACFLDLSIMLKTTDGDELGTYNELKGTVTFTIEAPKDMPCPEGKEYVVIRVHNGESTILPVIVNDDGTLSFETNKFSSYALALKDKEEEAVVTADKEELQTADTTVDTTPANLEEPSKAKSKTWIWAVIALALIAGCIAVFIGLKKKEA